MEGFVHNGWMDCGGLRRVKARGSRRGDNVYKGYELCLYAEHANVLDQESKTSMNPDRDHERMTFFAIDWVVQRMYQPKSSASSNFGISTRCPPSFRRAHHKTSLITKSRICMVPLFNVRPASHPDP